jgi:hypothetical protein
MNAFAFAAGAATAYMMAAAITLGIAIPALRSRYRLLTSMPGVGLVLACTLLAPAARARHNEPQTSRCIGWCRALCVREWQVQMKALHLGRSYASS